MYIPTHAARIVRIVRFLRRLIVTAFRRFLPANALWNAIRLRGVFCVVQIASRLEPLRGEAPYYAHVTSSLSSVMHCTRIRALVAKHEPQRTQSVLYMFEKVTNIPNFYGELVELIFSSPTIFKIET